MTRNRLRQIVFRFRKPLVSLVAFSVAIMVAELVIRSVGAVPRIHEISVSEANSPYLRSSNPILRYELKPDFRSRHRHGVSSTNAHGNRDRSRTYAKPDGVTRVILLGDSVVESVNLLGDRETINIQLEELYADNSTEVLNLAVAGYCTRAEVELLRTKGLKYQPDTVVVVFVENDFQNFNPDHSLDTQGFARPPGVNSLFRHSHFFRLLCVHMNWFGFNDEHTSETGNEQVWGDNNVADGFRLLRALADEYNFNVLVGIWPAFTDANVIDSYTMPGAPEHLVVEQLAWSNGIPTFRFSPDFRNDWKTRTEMLDGMTPRLFYTVDADSMHPSPPAARIAARTLHAVLTGRQPTRLQQPLSDATGIAAQLGAPKEPPDPLLERRPAYAVLLKQNRPRDARAYIEQLLAEDPSDADAWCLKAGSQGARGNLQAATQSYDRALSIDPQHVEALVWRGVIAYASGQNDSAIDYFQRALKQDPRHARACFHLGLAVAETSPEQAAESFRRATDVFPAYVDSYHELAKVLLVLKRPRKAEEACRRALEIEHDNAAVHFHLGRSHVMQNQYDKAVRSFDAAIFLNPEFAGAHMAASEAREQQGDTAAAIQHLRRVLEIQPGQFDATAKLAWMLATGGEDHLRDGDEAVRLALKCVQQVRNHRTLNVLAAAHAEVGDFKSAISTQEQAVAQAPSDARAALESRLRSYHDRQPHRASSTQTQFP